MLRRNAACRFAGWFCQRLINWWRRPLATRRKQEHPLNQVLPVAIDASAVYESAGPDACLPVPLTVAVYPESGGTVTVEQRIAATGE